MAGALTRMLGHSAPSGFTGTPDANTLFLCRFQNAIPVDEVDASTGTLVGDAFCDTANGELVLDGSGDYCTFAGGTKFDPTTNWCLEVHANMPLGDGGSIVARSTTGTSRYMLFISDVSGTIQCYSRNTAILTNASQTDGSWHHFAYVRDGGTWRFYKDGVQQTSVANAAASTSSVSDFYIGTDPGVLSRAVAPRIARVKLSNVVRYPSGTTFTPPSRMAA